MYTIEKKDYGIKLILEGQISLIEMRQWAEEVKAALQQQAKGFGVLVDVSKMGIMPQECIGVVIDVQNFAKNQGTGRNANIVGSSIAKLQQTRMAKESGLYSYMRYIDASVDKNPETKAQAWIIQGADPDK